MQTMMIDTLPDDYYALPESEGPFWVTDGEGELVCFAILKDGYAEMVWL